MTEKQNRNAYDEGFRSYKARKRDYANPYGLGTAEYDLYERGWVQALKRDLSGGRKISRAPTPAKQAAAASENEDAKAAYLKSKGR